MCVYLIQCGDYVKIGMARDVKKRLSSLQTGSPSPMYLLGHFDSRNDRQTEGLLHAKFREKRVSGEWFNLGEDDIEQIKAQFQFVDAEPTASRTPRLRVARDEKPKRAMTIEEFARRVSIHIKPTNFFDDYPDDDSPFVPTRIAKPKHKYRLEVTSNGRGYIWRIGSGKNRTSIYGGAVPKEIKQERALARKKRERRKRLEERLVLASKPE